MGFLKKLLQAANTPPPKRNKTDHTIEVTLDSIADSNNFLPVDQEAEDDFELLIKSLKEVGQTQEVDRDAIIKDVAPKADAHTCTYCGVVHEFKASRARKCPACKEKLIVRNGVFLNKDQAKKIDEETTAAYEQSYSLDSAKRSAEYLQEMKMSKNQGGYYSLTDFLLQLGRCFSEASLAVTYKDTGGFSFSDYAWRNFNRATLTDVQEYGFQSEQRKAPEIRFEMGEELMRRASLRKTNSSRRDNKRAAVKLYLESLIESATVGATPFYLSTIAQKVKTICKEESVSDSDLQVEFTDALEGRKLPDSAQSQATQYFKEVQAYEVL